MAQRPRFECQPGCTECCLQQGFVYLTEADLARAAKFLACLAPKPRKCRVVRWGRLAVRQPAGRLLIGPRGDWQSPRRITSCPTRDRPPAINRLAAARPAWRNR